MKRFTLVFALFAILSLNVFAQFTTGYNPETKTSKSALLLTFAGVLDTAAGTYDSLASQVFSLEDFDGEGYFTFYKKFTSTAGSPNILVDLYGSFDNSTYTLVEQLQDTTTSETATFTAKNLSNARAKYYKLVIEQVASGRDNSTFDVRIYAHKRDY